MASHFARDPCCNLGGVQAVRIGPDGMQPGADGIVAQIVEADA